jgi:hypothetical protein
MTAYVLAGAIGLLAGVVASLTGVGGGILFVPALTLLLGLSQVDAEGTSLLAIIPVAVVATLLQRRTGEVDLRAAGLVGLGAIPAAIGGAVLAHYMPEMALRVVFALLMVVIALRVWITSERA